MIKGNLRFGYLFHDLLTFMLILKGFKSHTGDRLAYINAKALLNGPCLF